MTGLIVNPGSGEIAAAGDHWTNTEATARAEAGKWLANMHAEGMTDVELLDGCRERAGRWLFTFRHKVTGVTVELETHGIDNLEAYGRDHFSPRVWWNGSSTAEPKLEDFAAPGFTPLRTFVPVATEEDQP
jgi:hypothetical protein